MTMRPNHNEILTRCAASRQKWGPRPKGVLREPVRSGEESVWDYPRPPEIRPPDGPASVVFAGREIANSNRCLRVVETAGAPVYYYPPEDVATAFLQERPGNWTVCEWKGVATHYDLGVGDQVSENAAFAYPDPLDDLGRKFSRIAGWIGFYPGRVDRALVNGETVRPQDGDIYAGWITHRIKGPIKGAPGTELW